MNRVLQIAKLVLLASAAFACCMIGAVCVQLEASDVPGRITTLLAHTDTLEGQLGRSVGSLNVALDHINRPCKGSGADKADNCGTLALAGQTMVYASNLIALSQSVENKQAALLDQTIPPLIARANQTLDNLNTATADLHPLILEATARTAALAPVEANAASLLADPRITAALTNLEASTADLAITSKESAATMASVQAIAADGQQEVHRILHPKPLTSVADWTLKVVHAIGGWY